MRLYEVHIKFIYFMPGRTAGNTTGSGGNDPGMQDGFGAALPERKTEEIQNIHETQEQTEKTFVDELKEIEKRLTQGMNMSINGENRLGEEVRTLLEISPPDLINPIKEDLQILKEKLETNEDEAAQELMRNIRNTVEMQNEARTWLKQKKIKARNYLKDPTRQTRTLYDPRVPNPFIGNLPRESVSVDYEDNTGEKNKTAEREQRALEGLPNFGEDGKPKIYKAVSPDGTQTKFIYWVPNLPGPEHFHLGGHFAQLGQRRELPAFVGHGWMISELEEQEKNDKKPAVAKAENQTEEKTSEAMAGKVRNANKQEGEALNGVAEAVREEGQSDAYVEKLLSKEAGKSIETKATLKSSLNEHVTQNEFLHVIEANNIEIEDLLISLSAERMTSAEEKSLTQEIPPGQETSQVMEISEPAKTTFETGTSRITELSSSETVPSHEPLQPDENTSLGILGIIFAKIKHAIIEKHLQSETKAVAAAAKNEALQIISFLEEIYANVEKQKTSEETSDQSIHIVSASELLQTAPTPQTIASFQTDAPLQTDETPTSSLITSKSTTSSETFEMGQTVYEKMYEEEKYEIIERSRENLQKVRAFFSEPLSFDT